MIGANSSFSTKSEYASSKHNIVSSGHLNIKCLGDFDLKAMGVGRMDFKGLASGPLLVKDSRLSAFNIQAGR